MMIYRLYDCLYVKGRFVGLGLQKALSSIQAFDVLLLPSLLKSLSPSLFEKNNEVSLGLL